MDKSALAVNGGIKAIEGFEGKGDPKIGHEEFLEMADIRGYSSETIDKIHAVIADEEMDGGPFPMRYKSGSKVAQMEHEVSRLLNVKNVMAVSNGTAALHTAYVAADFNEGDEVVVPGYTFMATAMAAVVARGIASGVTLMNP